MRRLLAAAVAGLALASPALAAKSLLGIRGDMARFYALTGQRSRVGHVMISWGQGHTFGTPFADLFASLGETPLVGLWTTAKWPSRGEAITPLQIAQGAGDGYLVAVNAAIAAFGRPIYIRPMGEMNAYWTAYCAYTKNGTPKGASHSTAAFRKAFARIYLILHGGPAAEIDARLRRLGLPPLKGRDLPENPYPMLRMIWNPQGYGAPDIPGNSAQAYYPGDAYVDVVGNDLYDIRGKAEWKANERLYKAHPTKPYAFPEWGLWGIDDPAFVRTMGRFVRTHKRVELLAYFNSKPGSIFDLATKPRSRAAYRAVITPLG